MNYTEILSNIQDGGYNPSTAYTMKPRRPKLMSNPTSADARRFADQLDQYSVDMEQWKTQRAQYNDDARRLFIQFHEDLMDVFETRGNPKEALLWDKVCNAVGSSAKEELLACYGNWYELIV